MKLETITLPEIHPDIEINQDFDQDEDLDSDVPWHVVLLDDQLHTYAYVIEMLGKIFRYSFLKAAKMAVEVDTKKRVIVWTGHLEHAEAKRDQVQSYGADWRIPDSKGSMSAILERAR